MYMRFKGMLFAAWELHDDMIVYKNKEIRLTDITKAEFQHCQSALNNGLIKLEVRGSFLGYTLTFSYNDNAQAYEAFEYIKKKAGLTKDEPAFPTGEGAERRMKCTVCGKIFCYTLADLQENQRLKSEAAMSAFTGFLQAVGGTTLNASADISRSDNLSSKVVDYTRCPNCNSSKIIDITDVPEEPEATNASSASPADEILKLKGLLDAGIITQDEFEAKKKQLLGL